MTGCARCWAHAERTDANEARELVDRVYREYRFAVGHLRCRACAQDFALVRCTLSQFARDRDDTGSHVIPLAPAEVEQLRRAAAEGDGPVEEFLRGLSPREYTVEAGGPVGVVHGAIRLLPHD